MLNHKTLFSFIISIFTISIGVSLSYSQMPSESSNSSSLSPEYIVKKFMTIGGQLNSINDSQLAGVSQGIPLNNTHMNNIQNNTTTDVSSQTTTNNLDFPKIYKTTVPSVVEVTAYNSNNHSIFKTGSGFIYNFNGIPTIITVSNLVAGKNDISITLQNGSSYYSNLTGYNPLTNLAILSINNILQNKLLSLQLANSSSLQEGQQVFTIGNTQGLKNQITSGIISGLEQPIPVLSQNSSKTLPKMPIGISTNLNLGNGYGGSPLLDTKGQVIGMNIGNYTLSDSANATVINSPSKNIELFLLSLLIQ